LQMKAGNGGIAGQDRRITGEYRRGLMDGRFQVPGFKSQVQIDPGSAMQNQRR
jgi:hypothetical protein